MSEYLKMAQSIKDELIENRRYLHANPEIGSDLPITTKFVMDKLQEYGIEGEIITDSAITACIGKTGGKTILLRGDMDALTIMEELDLDFKSTTEGRMHACGHDMHTTILLGAAKILKENEDKLEGQVKFMFQPNEEGLAGALPMIEAGILENPKVDFAMALHVLPALSENPTGTASVQSGPLLSGSQNFKIEVKGKGGHGGMPEYAKDPIAAANSIYSQLQLIKTREIAALEPLTMSICEFSFGDSYNVIPNEGVIKGTIRFFNKEIGEYTYKRLEEIVKSTGDLFSCETSVSRVSNTPPTVNDEAKAEEVRNILTHSLGSERVIDLKMKMTSSEDFAEVAERVPSVYIPVVAGSTSDGYAISVHNPKSLFDEECLPYGVAIFISTAIEWLKNNK